MNWADRFKSFSDINSAGGIRRRLILNVVAAAVILYTLWFVLHISVSAISSYRYPNEYREAANLDLTLSFIRGENPYAADNLNGDVPGPVYQYGPLFSLIVAGFHFILPFVDTLLLHYIVALLCVISAGVMAWFIVKKRTETLLPPSCAALFTMVCTWRYGYVNAVPDTLGVTLLVLIFLLEDMEKLKYREIPEALICVLLFYSKQYFVIVALSLFIYKLMTDRKGCLRLTVSGLTLLALSVVLLQITCPLFFTYFILVVHGATGESVADAAGFFGSLKAARSSGDVPPTGLAFEILQLKSLIGIFVFVFAGMVWGVVSAFKKRMPSFEGSRFYVIHSIVASAALIYLGQNDGAWLSYYLQILIPSVVIYAFITMEKKSLDMKTGLLLMILMTMFTTYRVDARLPVYDLSEKAKAEWERAYEYCDEKAAEGEVLYIAPMGFDALQKGRPLYDNGHEMAIHERFLKEYNEKPLYQKLFPLGGKLMEQHLAYRESVKAKVMAREYSLVATIPGTDEVVDTATLEAAGYVKTDVIDLDMGRISYELELWIPDMV